MQISLQKRLMKPLTELVKLLAISTCRPETSVRGLVISRQEPLAKPLVTLKLLALACALMLSTTVSAVGMGGINVTSALGQQLKAEIELVAIGKSEKDSLVARLASPEVYKNAGVDYPYGNKFNFQIESRADGQPYLKVSSSQPVNDPFVSLLIELTWSSGKLEHEYTFLLDPPGYMPEQPAQTSVQAVAPEVPTAAPVVAAPEVLDIPPKAAVMPVEQTAPAVAAAPVEQSAASAVLAAPTESAAKPETEKFIPSKATAKPATEHLAPAKTASVPANNKESLTVQRGDTLYKIAAQSKPADVSLERMLVAVYRINADQFDERNMNRVKVGKILQLPSQQDIESVSQSDALKEIHAQAADWNAYRQKLASTAGVSNQPQTALQIVTGKISSSVADKAPVVKESAKEVLKLSKGEAPGDQVGAGGKPMSEQDKKIAAQEDAIAKAKALKEEQMRSALLEKNLNDMQRLAQLKSEAAALAQPTAAATATSSVKAATAASAVKVATAASAVKPVPQPKQVKPEPSMLDQVLDEPLYLAGGAAVLLALGGLGFVIYRRKNKPVDEIVQDSTEQFGDITGRMAAPVVPSPDTGDFTGGMGGGMAAQAMTTPESDNVDPISEADLFLNFGRDVQAEEILKEALQNTPGNHLIHLKLLGIYANRKDNNSFAAIARQLQESGDVDAWQQAVAMGQKLEPGNPMYSGGGFKSTEDTGSATMSFNVATEPANIPKPQSSALDFDFDAGASAAQGQSSPEQDFLAGSPQSGDSMSASQGEHMDFDIGQVSSPAASNAVSGLGETMDFDIGSSNPAPRAAELGQSAPISNDMIFDMGDSHSFMPPTSQPEISKPADDGGMAFTLDFPIDSMAGKPAPVAQPAAAGLAGINLNFDDAVTAIGIPTGNKDEHWQEVATKLDLAKAYQEMGDNDGAREICEEVMREGDADQREAAQVLFEQLG